MDYWWQRFWDLMRLYGTPEFVLFGVAVGIVGGLLTGIVRICIEIIRSTPEAWAEGRAKGREKRLARRGTAFDTGVPGAPPNDISPTSDI